jgi:hypothetical protein
MYTNVPCTEIAKDAEKVRETEFVDKLVHASSVCIYSCNRLSYWLLLRVVSYKMSHATVTIFLSVVLPI